MVSPGRGWAPRYRPTLHVGGRGQTTECRLPNDSRRGAAAESTDVAAAHVRKCLAARPSPRLEPDTVRNAVPESVDGRVLPIPGIPTTRPTL